MTTIPLFGKQYTQDELRRRVGSMDQVAGIRTVQLDDGRERPTRAAYIHNGSGLALWVLVDRCLDVSAASYNGIPMAWRSRTGDVAPQYYEAEGVRWLRSFFGGLVATCGLITAGPPQSNSALEGTGLHGRIGNTPATDVCIVQEWQGDEYVLSVSGLMRESRVFGENLTLRRTISTKLGAKRFWLDDVLTNEGFQETPYMLLYHCNIGWPVVDEGSEMISPSRYVAPRDVDAKQDRENWNRFEGPVHGYREKVYYHDMQADSDDMVTAAVVNDRINGAGGLGVYVKYRRNTLPRFMEWKQMGEQDYTVGFEPASCTVEGREVEAEQGLLHSLKPGESRSFHLELGAVTTPDEVDALRAGCSQGTPELVDSYRRFIS